MLAENGDEKNASECQQPNQSTSSMTHIHNDDEVIETLVESTLIA